VPVTFRANTARHILAMLAIGSALAACETSPGPPPPPIRSTAATASPEPAELAALRARPLRLPTLAPGDACPLTQPAPPNPPPPPGHPLSTGGAPSALGHAPVFPDARYFHLGNQLRVRALTTRPGWYGTKAPWASRTGYLGWTLIRTARLDGPGRAQIELQLADGSNVAGDAVAVDVLADWQFWPGGTDVTNAGCYAYQVDGTGFTEVIVFRADLAS
jgi:hypothetical protein